MISKQPSDDIYFDFVAFESDKAYADMLSLRSEVLRYGLPSFTADQLQSEKDDLHVGMYRGSHLIGCCLIRREGDWLQMRQVAIGHKEQGKGLGSMLITYFENYSRSIGISKLFIEARVSAVPFYLRHEYVLQPESFVNDGSGLVNYRLEKFIDI